MKDLPNSWFFSLNSADELLSVSNFVFAVINCFSNSKYCCSEIILKITGYNQFKWHKKKFYTDNFKFTSETYNIFKNYHNIASQKENK